MSTWGPDGTLSLNENEVYEIKIPKNHRAVFRFSADAWWENACIIYPSQPRESEAYAIRGNYGRHLSDWQAPVSSSREQYFIITGWHKDSPPKASKPWHQSKIRIDEESTNGRFYEVSFEDIHSSDGFDDLRVTITINPNSFGT